MKPKSVSLCVLCIYFMQLTVFYVVWFFSAFEDCHCSHIHIFYELGRLDFSGDIQIVNRVSVSFRIEGMSLVVFAIFHLLQSFELSDRFRGRDCECSHIALNSE